MSITVGLPLGTDVNICSNFELIVVQPLRGQCGAGQCGGLVGSQSVGCSPTAAIIRHCVCHPACFYHLSSLAQLTTRTR